MTKQQDIYLLAFYHMRPRPGVRTQVKGWMDDLNNITYDENVEITRGKRKHINTAKVVLNLSQKRVEYNGWGTERSFDEYFKHFFKGYHQYITAVMSQLDVEYFNKMLDEMQVELDVETAKETEAVAE
jgi:hypothetical protein